MWPGATDEETNRKAAQERKNAKSKVRIYDSFPIKNFDHWIEESKSHLWIVDVAGDRKARSLFAGSKVAAAPGFGGEALGAVWSPDGQSVVFVATENDGIAARANVASHLWQVAANGGEPRRLTPDGFDFGAPAFRPDGKALCFTASDAEAGDLPADTTRLFAVAVEFARGRLGRHQELRPLDRQLVVRSRQPDGVLHRRGRRARTDLRGGRDRRNSEARRRRAPGRVHEPADSFSRFVGRRVRQLGERGPAGRDRPRRSGHRQPHVPDLVHGQGRRVDRLAAAARVLVHGSRRTAHPQFHRAAAELRRVEEVSALRPHPRRAREHVARFDHVSLELPPPLAARLHRPA